jgi:uncharacterized RDD family membrane protein YckC
LPQHFDHSSLKLEIPLEIVVVLWAPCLVIREVKTMIKGLAGMILAAIIFAAVLFLILNFIGVIALIVGILAIGFIVVAILMVIVLFIFGFLLFFALFYYMFEKKPEITPGNYTLDMVKGKNE